MTPDINAVLQWVALLLLVLPQAAWAAGNLTQNSSRECAICHFRWMDQFVAGHGTELAPLETEDVAGKEMMCLSCHDGSTDDSRTKIWLRDRHRTEMIPTEKVKIPKIFPLSRDGKMVCATCHSAHSVPTDTSIERTIFLRVSSRDSQMCEMCHISQHDQQRINHPLHRGKTAIPEEITKAGGILSVTDKNHLICESCHTAHGGVEHKNLLFPAQDSTLCGICHTQLQQDMLVPLPQLRNHPLQTEVKKQAGLQPLLSELSLGSGNSIQCLSCHLIHGSQKNEAEIAQQSANHQSQKILRFPAANSALCTVCHPDRDDSVGDGALGAINHPIHVEIKNSEKIAQPEVLKSGNRIQCMSCHQIHNHPGNRHALVLRRNHLCSACHQGKELITGTDHDLSVTAPKNRNSSGKTVAESGLCGSCHIPHRAQGPFLWSGPRYGNEKDASSYCLGCHSDGGAAAKKTVGSYSHPLGIPVETQSPLPLFTSSNGKKMLACPSCHDPHQWSPTNNKIGQGKNLEGSPADSFLRLPAGTSPLLCESCHKEKFTIAGTDHDMAVTAPDAQNVKGQKVTEAGICSSCHLVHNATAVKLWARQLENQANGRHELCRTCHSPEKPGGRKVIGPNSHPVKVTVSQEIDLPLTREETDKKLMSCQTCHDPHTWAPGKDRPPGTNTEGTEDTSFLRKPNIEKPLLCGTCHPDQALVFGTDHDLRTIKDENGRALHTGENSVCTPCHLVHNSKDQTILWNGPMAQKGQDFMEKICYGCHSSGGAGKNKTISSGSHPTRLYFGYRASYRDLLPANIQSTPVPLYDNSGRKTDAGEISCPTCHDPHIWSARERKQGQGTNPEGTVVDSFLRPGARNEICYACHGATTLLLYRFYHDAGEKQLIHGKNLRHLETEEQNVPYSSRRADTGGTNR